MATWVNSDGLRVNFGLDQVTPERAAKVNTLGEVKQLVVKILGTEVPSTDAPLSKMTGIPDKAFIVSAQLYVTTAFVGASATLDIGLWSDDGDGTYTVIDMDGIDAAIATTALDTVGQGADDFTECDGALVGVRLNTVAGGRDVLVSTHYNTAAFTAGEATLVINYKIFN